VELSKKAVLYKNMFIISTVCGALGVYFLLKGFKLTGWILVGIWGVLGLLVRVMIIRDKKLIKDKKS